MNIKQNVTTYLKFIHFKWSRQKSKCTIISTIIIHSERPHSQGYYSSCCLLHTLHLPLLWPTLGQFLYFFMHAQHYIVMSNCCRYRKLCKKYCLLEQWPYKSIKYCRCTSCVMSCPDHWQYDVTHRFLKRCCEAQNLWLYRYVGIPDSSAFRLI